VLPPEEVDRAGRPAWVETAVRGNKHFALDLYRTQRETPVNLIFSPYSVSVALAMTYAGARGQTEAQMARALHFDLEQMMAQKKRFGYAEFDGLQALELPYAGEDVSMIVLLPGEIDGLAVLEDALTVENLARWTANLQEGEVEVFLPCFEVTFPVRLDGALKSLGMLDAFSGAADFSGMNGSLSLHLAAVLHRAFVKVNEQGAEAAAATAVVMARLALPPPPVFRADHPFLFLIREKRTGSILFLGRVVSPEGS
jgi:serine protease inhibitor